MFGEHGGTIQGIGFRTDNYTIWCMCLPLRTWWATHSMQVSLATKVAFVMWNISSIFNTITLASVISYAFLCFLWLIFCLLQCILNQFLIISRKMIMLMNIETLNKKQKNNNKWHNTRTYKSNYVSNNSADFVEITVRNWLLGQM